METILSWCEACGTLLSNKEPGFLCCNKEADITTDAMHADALRQQDQDILCTTITQLRGLLDEMFAENYSCTVHAHNLVHSKYDELKLNDIHSTAASKMTPEEESKIWRDWAKEAIDFDEFDKDKDKDQNKESQ